MTEIEQIGPALSEEIAACEELRHLSPRVLELLRKSSLRYLKYPAVLGGAEADNALQWEVIERLGYYNGAASWCMFIYMDMIGMLAAHLPEEGRQKLFSEDIPLACGGSAGVMGEMVPVEGGYRLSGRWIYGSGIEGCDWVACGAIDKSNPELPPRYLVFPASEVKLVDNWHVLGMRGSGSCDFYVENIFVPVELTYPLDGTHPRGGILYDLSLIGYIAHTVPAVAMGIAQRAVDELAGIAKAKMRGYSKKISLAQRGVFQAFLAEADMKIRSGRALMLENGLRLFEEAKRDSSKIAAVEGEARAAGAYVMRQMMEVVSDAVRHAGGDGIRQGGFLEQAVRDVHTADTHYVCGDISMEVHGQFILGLQEADQTV
ncbi:acyl-CoA dehydrogenase family protein [Sphingobium sp.]|uniref:acyl-CoA dehydrogenase family protein n=1 Tax=Sphingobium sp. TaxID=1912891 RepID=UPI0028BF0603|nr:acyl-CoA dehydrogenase family protein [Sphingobium sp.]